MERQGCGEVWTDTTQEESWTILAMEPEEDGCCWGGSFGLDHCAGSGLSHRFEEEAIAQVSTSIITLRVLDTNVIQYFTFLDVWQRTTRG
jgi:hypothetical protein